MRPAPGEALHFSEDPTIEHFIPRGSYVWAVDGDRSPDYWFPRDCPRAMAWTVPSTTVDEDCHALVATEPVRPLGPPVPVGDLLALHEAAGIQLRVLHNLWPFWDAVLQSSLGFSGMRLRNALRRKESGPRLEPHVKGGGPNFE
jgi:hypothetical protein